MVLLSAKEIELYSEDFEIPNFKLKNIDDNFVSKDDLIFQKSGILVCFICNHCPYVKAIIKDIVDDAKFLHDNYNIQTVCINPNVANDKYEDDSFEKMKLFANQNKFVFPYLSDEDQSVAKKFNAVCTPDLFLFLNNTAKQKFLLKYKGRLNNFIYKANGPQTSEFFEDKKSELVSYVTHVFSKPNPSMGCSIKWIDN